MWRTCHSVLSVSLFLRTFLSVLIASFDFQNSLRGKRDPPNWGSRRVHVSVCPLPTSKVALAGKSMQKQRSGLLHELHSNGRSFGRSWLLQSASNTAEGMYSSQSHTSPGMLERRRG